MHNEPKSTYDRMSDALLVAFPEMDSWPAIRVKGAAQITSIRVRVVTSCDHADAFGDAPSFDVAIVMDGDTPIEARTVECMSRELEQQITDALSQRELGRVSIH